MEIKFKNEGGVRIQSKGNVSSYLILNTCIFIPSATISMKLNEMHQKSMFLFNGASLYSVNYVNLFRTE